MNKTNNKRAFILLFSIPIRTLAPGVCDASETRKSNTAQAESERYIKRVKLNVSCNCERGNIIKLLKQMSILRHIFADRKIFEYTHNIAGRIETARGEITWE